VRFLGGNRAGTGANSAAVDVEAELPLIDARRSFIGQVMYCIGNSVAFVLFWPVVPRGPMLLWGGVTLFWQFIWFTTFFALVWRKPNAREAEAFWAPIGFVLTVISILTVIWAVWLLTPYATDQLRLILVMLLATFVAVAMMTGTNVMHVDGLTTIGVLGSLAINLLSGGRPYALLLAGFVIAYLLTMLTLCHNRHRLIEDIVAAKHEVERNRDAKLRFLTSAWHDLGQPLQSARLFFDQAMRAELPARRTLAHASALDAFATMERQLRQMLDHLRLESGTVTPVIAPTSVSLLIAQASELAEPAAAAAKIDLRLCPSRYRVLADADMAGRAISNFIQNAIRHAKCQRILVCARRYRTRIRVYVIDDGAGIANADTPLLFDDFMQGSDHGDEIRGGFGLGLASARRIAQLLNGNAGHDARWRHGSAFFLELPSADALAF
jgi:signal transduction histidine kinase